MERAKLLSNRDIEEEEKEGEELYGEENLYSSIPSIPLGASIEKITNDVVGGFLEDNRDFIQQLPLELVVEIIMNLRPTEILNLCSISSFFNSYICNNNSLNIWSRIYRRDISETIPIKPRTIKGGVIKEARPIKETTLKEFYIVILENTLQLNLDEALRYAIRQDYEKLAEFYLDLGANPKLNEDIPHLATPLIEATRNNNLIIMQMLIDRGADIHYDFDTVFLISIALNNYDAFKLLLNNGADIHVFGDRPIISAVEQLARLKDRIKRLESSSGGEEEPFKNRHIQFLFKKIANIELIIKDLLNAGANPTVYAEALIDNGVLLNQEDLIQEGLKVGNIGPMELANLQQYYLNEKFLKAVEDRNVDKVLDLIREGANVHFKNNSALIRAVNNKDLLMVNIIIDNATLFRPQDVQSAMRVALKKKQDDIVQSLLNLNTIDERTYLRLVLDNMIDNYSSLYYKGTPLSKVKVVEGKEERSTQIIKDLKSSIDEFIADGIYPTTRSMNSIIGTAPLNIIKLIIPHYLTRHRPGRLSILINSATRRLRQHERYKENPPQIQEEDEAILQYILSL